MLHKTDHFVVIQRIAITTKNGIHRVTLTSLMILSMFIVAKAILEVGLHVLTVLQELNVIRSALLLLCSSKAGTQSEGSRHKIFQIFAK